MVESNSAQKSTRELIKLAVLVAVAFMLFFQGIGFVLTKSYTSLLPGITRLVIEIRHALSINGFLIVPVTVFVLILVFLIENFVITGHQVTFKIYRGFNIFFIILNILLTWSVVVPLLRR